MLLQLLVAFVFPSFGVAACTGQATPVNGIRPNVASGWEWAVVATGLNNPRSIAFDLQGRLVVVARGTGVAVLELNDHGGTCVTEKSRNTIINSTLVKSRIPLRQVLR